MRTNPMRYTSTVSDHVIPGQLDAYLRRGRKQAEAGTLGRLALYELALYELAPTLYEPTQSGVSKNVPTQ